ncbi:MAG TPA: hypothetical protein VGY58_03450 [Gemmataceae bacterium]|nr:hypothetical protein [Gemmataceae bacterium]
MAMRLSRAKTSLTLLLLATAAGCSSTMPELESTGAAEAAQEHCDALVRGDWTRAYAGLDASSRQRLSEQQFTRLIRKRWQAIGFEPQEAHVRSCEEHGAEAIAHVALNGHAASRLHFYKDAVVLRRSATGWEVVLSPASGQFRSEVR